MKTKELIERLEAEGCTIANRAEVRSGVGSVVTVMYRGVRIAETRTDTYGVVNTNFDGFRRHLISSQRRWMLETLFAYALTSVELRQYEMRHFYRLPAVGPQLERLYLKKTGGGGLTISAEPLPDVLSNPAYRFTDAEIQYFPANVKLLFSAAEKEQVTAHEGE